MSKNKNKNKSKNRSKKLSKRSNKKKMLERPISEMNLGISTLKMETTTKEMISTTMISLNRLKKFNPI